MVRIGKKQAFQEHGNRALATRTTAPSGLAGVYYIKLLGEGYAVRESMRRALKAAYDNSLRRLKGVAASQNRSFRYPETGATMPRILVRGV